MFSTFFLSSSSKILKILHRMCYTSQCRSNWEETRFPLIHTLERSVSTCNKTAADGQDNVINIDLILFYSSWVNPLWQIFPFYYSHNSCETVFVCGVYNAVHPVITHTHRSNQFNSALLNVIPSYRPVVLQLYYFFCTTNTKKAATRYPLKSHYG